MKNKILGKKHPIAALYKTNNSDDNSTVSSVSFLAMNKERSEKLKKQELSLEKKKQEESALETKMKQLWNSEIDEENEIEDCRDEVNDSQRRFESETRDDMNNGRRKYKENRSHENRSKTKHKQVSLDKEAVLLHARTLAAEAYEYKHRMKQPKKASQKLLELQKLIERKLTTTGSSSSSSSASNSSNEDNANEDERTVTTMLRFVLADCCFKHGVIQEENDIDKAITLYKKSLDHYQELRASLAVHGLCQKMGVSSSLSQSDNSRERDGKTRNERIPTSFAYNSEELKLDVSLNICVVLVQLSNAYMEQNEKRRAGEACCQALDLLKKQEHQAVTYTTPSSKKKSSHLRKKETAALRRINKLQRHIKKTLHKIEQQDTKRSFSNTGKNKNRSPILQVDSSDEEREGSKGFFNPYYSDGRPSATELATDAAMDLLCLSHATLLPRPKKNGQGSVGSGRASKNGSSRNLNSGLNNTSDDADDDDDDDHNTLYTTPFITAKNNERKNRRQMKREGNKKAEEPGAPSFLDQLLQPWEE